MDDQIITDLAARAIEALEEGRARAIVERQAAASAHHLITAMISDKCNTVWPMQVSYNSYGRSPSVPRLKVYCTDPRHWNHGTDGKYFHDGEFDIRFDYIQTIRYSDGLRVGSKRILQQENRKKQQEHLKW